MANTIDMQLMRYINLFEKVSGVSTRHCFVYNNIIIFAVPFQKVSVAVGKNGQKAKKLAEILSRRVKVIALPNGEEDLERFVSDIVEPSSFNKIDVHDGMVTISAGRQNKAALIGRNRAREQELESILRNSFNIKKLRIL